MRKVAIVTDSNAGLSNELAEKLNVKVVPMPFQLTEKNALRAGS